MFELLTTYEKQTPIIMLFVPFFLFYVGRAVIYEVCCIYFDAVAFTLTIDLQANL